VEWGREAAGGVVLGGIEGGGGVRWNGSSVQGEGERGRGKEREREAGGEVIMGSMGGEVF